jgi:hypothetical protein
VRRPTPLQLEFAFLVVLITAAIGMVLLNYV